MNKICPYQSHTYIGYDEIKVENCPIQEYYTEETEVCCYDSDYKNCPIYNLQSKIDKAIEFINSQKKTISKSQADLFNEDRGNKSKLKVGTFMWNVDELLDILKEE